MNQNKRRSPRFSIQQLIRMSWDREEFLQAEGVNISSTGMLLHSSVPMEHYSTLFLMFEIESSGGPRTVKTEGVVMRCEKEEDYYSIGVEFTELTEAEKKELNDFLSSLD